MPLIQDQTKESLELELKRVDRTDAGVRAAIEQAQEIVRNLQSEFDMSEKDAKLAVLGNIKSSAEEDGATLEQVLKNYPAALREYIQYSPEELQKNQQVTVKGSAVSAILFVASLAFGVTAVIRAVALGSRFLPAIYKLLRYPRAQQTLANLLQTFKIELGRQVALLGVLMGGTAALGWLASTAINNWNDVFHWGPQMAENQALQIANTLERELRPTGTGSAGTFVPRTYTRTQTTKTAKPKVYVGTLLAGKVAPGKDLVRKVDDEITDEQDLINDAQINLTNWLMALPGKLTYEIQIKFNPFDENQVRKVGYWVTLALYVNNNLNKRLFIDEILLGPIDPVKYYPDSLVSKTLSVQIPRELSPTEIKTFLAPDGRLTTVDNEGNIVSVFTTTPSVANSAGVPIVSGIPTAILFPEIPKDIAEKIDRGEIKEGDFVPGYGVLKPDGTFAPDSRVAGGGASAPLVSPIGAGIPIEPTPEQLVARLKPIAFEVKYPTTGMFRATNDFGTALYHRAGNRIHSVNLLDTRLIGPLSQYSNAGEQGSAAVAALRSRYGIDYYALPAFNMADLQTDQTLERSGRAGPDGGYDPFLFPIGSVDEFFALAGTTIAGTRNVPFNA